MLNINFSKFFPLFSKNLIKYSCFGRVVGNFKMPKLWKRIQDLVNGELSNK